MHLRRHAGADWFPDHAGTAGSFLFVEGGKVLQMQI